MLRHPALFICLSVAMAQAFANMPEVKIAQQPLSAERQDGRICVATGLAGNMIGAGAVSDGDFVYQAGFDPSDWSGSLAKRRLDRENGNITLASSLEWDAADILTGSTEREATPAPDARRIYTSLVDGGERRTVEFKWEALSDTQKQALDISPVDGKADGMGEQRVGFLRGARELETGRGGSFRSRNRILGDIANSNPVFAGAPSPGTRGAGYQAFLESHKNRVHAIYVGVNDGMLHAFNADNGEELFAYIPDAFIPDLTYLTQPGYAHRPYADGGIAVAEAYAGKTWKTVLASGMGGGAQGLFALDVTDPADFASGAGALWEFTDADDPDMGNLTSAPSIAKFRTGTSGGVPQYRYFVVASSGLNNYVPDGDDRSDSAAPGALFLLSLDKPASAGWAVGVNYFKFKLPIGDTDMPDGLGSPAVATGRDGEARYVYAGDLQGNLWRFDFTEGMPWSEAAGALLFRAADADGNPQPITERPAVAYAPGGGYVVLFGTGKFIEGSDLLPENFGKSSFYAIYDPGPKAKNISGRGQLAARALRADGNGFAVSGERFDYGDGKRGWYLDFPDAEKTGERSIAQPVLSYGRVFFTTLIPGDGTCDTREGRSYSLDALSGLSEGSATGYASGAGLPASSIPLDGGNAGTGKRSGAGERIVSRTYRVFDFGSGGVKGNAVSPDEAPRQAALPAGRFSWREILNWMELDKATGSKRKGTQ